MIKAISKNEINPEMKIYGLVPKVLFVNPDEFPDAPTTTCPDIHGCTLQK